MTSYLTNSKLLNKPMIVSTKTMNTLPSNVINSFFAPVQTDLITPLLNAYDSELTNLRKAMETVKSAEFSKALDTFIEASRSDRGSAVYTKMFDLDEATKLLNANYWQRSMNITDIYDNLPQKRRDEWSDMIRERKCPQFDKNTVLATFDELLKKRSMFIAERVDGIFKGLSGEHVTNSPLGFGKRMIIGNVIRDQWSLDYSKAGLIDDLRKIIAKLLGRDEPRHNTSSDKLYKQINYTGEWYEWDGGTLRVKTFKKGTVHLEINPEISWQLNQILAFLYPQALSHTSIRKPEKVSKDFTTINNPISGEILYHLGKGYWNGTHEFEPVHELKDKVMEILFSVGGVKQKKKKVSTFRERREFFVDVIKFDYDAKSVVDKIIFSGMLPDKVTHQYYPTPKTLSELVLDYADIGQHHTVLEPSAGQGGLLSDDLIKDNVTCYELSEIHCEILKGKGFANVINQDFLTVPTNTKYDRIVMNPPFSEGRAKLHLQHAIDMLAESGTLVAILPSGMRDKQYAGCKSIQYSEVLHNQFPDARVSVVICTIEK